MQSLFKQPGRSSVQVPLHFDETGTEVHRWLKVKERQQIILGQKLERKEMIANN